ncbi:hypothetical protein LZ480_09455 [Solibacillus sp. MA9]|uniref:Uncharacterized protein n=1 Tax=Solibacillus palustris TaxID=2908203 RepID=A0ABS9UCP7_9BACL|nr:hypothetical protein [Solibacillus sp. MA9]MCH7322116.1 hypothetical protein [Solibacillus sp. MA9]
MGTTVILFVVTFFLFINHVSSKEELSEERPTISPEIQAENEKRSMELENFLFGNNGIIKQVNDELLMKGYTFQTLIIANSIDDIQLKYVLENKEATESEQKVVKSIFFDLVEKNNLDSYAFELKVGDIDDGPDW